MIEALYIHIPFCRTICAYCDFCRAKYNKKLVDDYLEALGKELAAIVKDAGFKTVYIGGGTPSALNEEQLERLFLLLQPYTKQVQEYTIEINPETLTGKKARLMGFYGINRASIGIQTFDRNLLNLIGRIHTRMDIDRTIGYLMDQKITNLSFDLMYGLPTQTLDQFMDSLETALSYPVTHLSLYLLTIEENSRFGRLHIKAQDQDLSDDMYFAAIDRLERSGFKQYEISNFAKDGYRSQHNLAYWHYDDFLGAGLGASGKIGNRRLLNTSNFMEYLRGDWLKEVVTNSESESLFERIMMNLRLKEGLALNEPFKSAIMTTQGSKIDKLIMEGYLEINDGFLKATDKGYYILSEILMAFLPET